MSNILNLFKLVGGIHWYHMRSNHSDEWNVKSKYLTRLHPPYRHFRMFLFFSLVVTHCELHPQISLTVSLVPNVSIQQHSKSVFTLCNDNKVEFVTQINVNLQESNRGDHSLSFLSSTIISRAYILIILNLTLSSSLLYPGSTYILPPLTPMSAPPALLHCVHVDSPLPPMDAGVRQSGSCPSTSFLHWWEQFMPRLSPRLSLFYTQTTWSCQVAWFPDAWSDLNSSGKG